MSSDQNLGFSEEMLSGLDFGHVQNLSCLEDFGLDMVACSSLERAEIALKRCQKRKTN